MSVSKNVVTIVVGVGPGIGGSLVRRFFAAGHTVCMIARSQDSLQKIKTHILNSTTIATTTSTATATATTHNRLHCFPCDVTDEKAVDDTFKQIINNVGKPTNLLYNASARRFRPVPVHETNPNELISFWKIQCYGAFLCSRAVIPSMLSANSGCIIFTGATASVRAAPGLSTFSIGKFGLRALAQTLAREYQAKGIHVAHLILDGPVRSPIVEEYVKRQIAKSSSSSSSPSLSSSSSSSSSIVVPDGVLMEPDDIAEQVYYLSVQPSSVWTQELDMRSKLEPIYSKI